MRERYSLVAAAITTFFIAGCGHGQFQTAKTVKKGGYRVTMAQQLQGNKDVVERGVSPANFPPDIMVRVGVADNADIGASLFLFGGLIVDAKVNLLNRMDKLALSVGGGVGGAADWGSLRDTLAVLHVPIKAIVSYRLGRSVTPYFGLGYGFYWLFGRDELDIPPPEDPNTEVVGWKGHGDGVLRFTIGFEHMVNARLGVLLEYSYWLPVVDDPGDHFIFVDNHLAGIGIAF